MTYDRELRERIVEAIGEDPARFLDHDLVGDDDARRLAVARIEGIDRLQVINCWKQCERALARDTREKVLALLDRRRDYLLEHGERGDRPRRDPETIEEWSAETIYLDADGNPVERGRSATAKLHEVRQ
ncbi:hypothetical protein [Haloarchaeobius baliensis]|uniref:hypothetical protein n=1 Tax=Haloarchaeobius baliensis TaxID=1670458 RepID=UPI003F883C3A